MSLPINGRIVVVDDQIEQAMPILCELSKRRCSYSYYTGELKSLPDAETQKNDIRVLFLDIYLSGDESRTDREVRSSLVPVLERIISESNFPYVLIYWSRHENEHDDLIQKIFEEDLNDRKPIAFLSLSKSDYFSLIGEETAEFEKKIETLWADISDLIKQVPVYKNLLVWENKVHSSADKTLEEIFSECNDKDEWENNSNYIFNKLGISYSGKNYDNQEIIEKTKSSLYALNIVLSDALDYSVTKSNIQDHEELEYNDEADRDVISIVNKKLLTSAEIDPPNYPGTILKADKSSEDEYLEILDKMLRKKNKKDKIAESMIKIWLLLTPLCDFAQDKIAYNRVVRGILFRKQNRKTFFSNEAIFVSPSFEFEKQDYAIGLHFSEFFGIKKIPPRKCKPLFRIRQQLLAEVQSKLARHVSRQGVLFLDER